MPWCQRCDRFLNPNTVNADGTCPSCGRLVDPGRARPAVSSISAAETQTASGLDSELSQPDAVGEERGTEGPEDEEEDYKAPWHFWVMVVGVVVYLGWRLIEAIIWGWDRLF